MTHRGYLKLNFYGKQPFIYSFFLIYSTVPSLGTLSETENFKYNNNLGAYIFTFFIAVFSFRGVHLQS